MSAPEWVTLAVASLALTGVVVTALMTRRSSRETNATSAWAALTAAHQAEMARLSARLDKLEKVVEQERRERHSLTEVLRLALGYIARLGVQIRELGGHPEAPPPEVDAWMRRDGLVVDRIETTISRTTVTDTRSPDDQLDVEQVDFPTGTD